MERIELFDNYINNQLSDAQRSEFDAKLKSDEEGKMLLVDEKVVGKEVDEAIEYIINIENETGYLVSGEFVSEPELNKITIQISVNDENIKNSLNEVINKAIETTCDKLHIKETVEWAEDITHQNLVELAMKADPTLTSEEASKLTNEQLLDIIKLYQIETAEIYSVELEELYNQIKDYELQFTETEFVNETIKSFIHKDSLLGCPFKIYKR